MIALASITIQDKIYESANSLVYRGITDDGLAIVIKMLKQDYPSPSALTRYKQEYGIIRALNLEGVIKAYSQQDYHRTLVILLEDVASLWRDGCRIAQKSSAPCLYPLFSGWRSI
jgi:hypothetical protein